MAGDDKAKRIAMMMVGAPPPGGRAPPDGDAVDPGDGDGDEGNGDLEDAMGGLREAMRSGDDAEAAAAFRAAVQAVG